MVPTPRWRQKLWDDKLAREKAEADAKNHSDKEEQVSNDTRKLAREVLDSNDHTSCLIRSNSRSVQDIFRDAAGKWAARDMDRLLKSLRQKRGAKPVNNETDKSVPMTPQHDEQTRFDEDEGVLVIDEFGGKHYLGFGEMMEDELTSDDDETAECSLTTPNLAERGMFLKGMGGTTANEFGEPDVFIGDIDMKDQSTNDQSKTASDTISDVTHQIIWAASELSEKYGDNTKQTTNKIANALFESFTDSLRKAQEDAFSKECREKARSNGYSADDSGIDKGDQGQPSDPSTSASSTSKNNKKRYAFILKSEGGEFVERMVGSFTFQEMITFTSTMSNMKAERACDIEVVPLPDPEASFTMKVTVPTSQ